MGDILLGTWPFNKQENQFSSKELHAIINHSRPKAGISKITVIGSDGYSMKFDWDSVKSDDRLLLIEENDYLRLIAGDYDLSFSVKYVTRIVVE